LKVTFITEFNFVEIFGKFHKQLEETPDEFNIRDDKAMDLNLMDSQPKKKAACCQP
jgi:hypothetical protein